jgi:uncharacterized protein YutE (UPF0331/DUF86 family)
MTEETQIIKTLISEIRFELEKVLSLKDDMILLRSSFESSEPDKFECSAAGYLLHNLYNGIENIFKSIASVFGNNVDKAEWHSALLKRMLLEIEDVRPKVISVDLYKKLLEYKNFRHFFRHAYLFELDWDKMKRLVDDFTETIDRIEQEIGDFINQVRNLEAAGNGAK